MFANAYKIATKFTRPVIISTRTFNGEVKSGCGAFILLNKEGWILTVAHLLDFLLAHKEHIKGFDTYKSEVERIQNDNSLNEKQKRKKINKLNPNKGWITNFSSWWGGDKNIIEEFQLFF